MSPSFMNDEIRGLIENHRLGWTLARPFYTDSAVYELEVERIFRKSWLFAGHISRIPKPGDYFLYEFEGESLIIIRADDDRLHALLNVCRHRGSRVCPDESGHVHYLVCPYHAWAYERDGRLKAARLMPDDFDRTQFGLCEARLQVLEGFIFVSLADDPPDFTPVVRDIRPHLEPHEFGQVRICHTARRLVRANWKILAENFRECYHCGPSHPELCRTLLLAAAVGSPRLTQKERHLNEQAMARWRQMGLVTDRVAHTVENWFQAYRVPIGEGMVSLTLDGQFVAPPMGCFGDPEEVGHLNVAILPTFCLEASVDHALIMCFTPVGPALTRLQMDWLVRGDAVEGVDYEVERVTEMWQIVGDQDWKLCEDTQAGVTSRHYQPGPYAEIESKPDIFVRWYLRQL
ncbi:MAG: aromatic ring-hydroxylating dioxygenase subunit alpha [Ardenticatenaceae bacterium]|nr:aromatic ring-hydroxylating dioxygenase subunit alpha [Ardenticatenaceae bacterium]